MKLTDMIVSRKTEEMMRRLYPMGEADRMIRKYKKEKIVLLAAVATVAVLVFLPLFFYDLAYSGEPVKSLSRNAYGDGKQAVTVDAVTDSGIREKISVTVNERRYTKTELEEFSKRLDTELWRAVLGSNTDSGCVKEDLQFMSRIEGYPFEITWRTDEPLLVSSSGGINRSRLNEEDPESEGIPVMIRATLKYKDYTEDKYSYVVVCREEMGTVETVKEEIERSIEEYDKKSETDAEQRLPEAAGGRKITFYRSSVNRGLVVLALGLVSALLIMSAKDRKIRDEAENRRKQMEADYPNILNQYALYFTAGMNPRAIWSAICSRYEEDVVISGKRGRYAYEEMITAKRMMDEGLSELAAYDLFAARCDNVRYRAFISFVKQTAEKGGGGLKSVLYEEMEKAKTERNNLIKVAASEAETKLLLPMFMMLLVVLAIVMVPAFIGLNT